MTTTKLALRYEPSTVPGEHGVYVGRMPPLPTDGARPWVRVRAPRSPQSEERARDRILALWEQAAQAGKTGADFGITRRTGRPAVHRPAPRPAPDGDEPETVSDWFDRYSDWRETAKGHVTVENARSRFARWVEPVIGSKTMVEVTREHIESIVADLDAAIRRRADLGKPHGMTWKSAANVWSDITSAFKAACTSKDRSLRVLERSPTENVQGPDRGQHRAEPFLFPDEVVKLLSCATVPLHWRETYAVAIYTGARSSELEALTGADVDLVHMKVTIAKQIDRKTGELRDQTKTKRARPIDVEPALAPLLERLVKRAGDEGRLLRMPVTEERASLLRRHLAEAGCTREDLTADDAMRAQMKFHGLRHTCLTHMAVRGDDPIRIQWRAGHTTFAMTEKYISEGRRVSYGFGTPLPPLPASLVSPNEHEVEEQPEAVEAEGGKSISLDSAVQPCPAVQTAVFLNDFATPTGIEPVLPT